jgi:hypothetical protein
VETSLVNPMLGESVRLQDFLPAGKASREPEVSGESFSLQFLKGLMLASQPQGCLTNLWPEVPAGVSRVPPG